MFLKQINLILFLMLSSFIVLDAEICSFETSCACSYRGEDGNFTNCNYINLAVKKVKIISRENLKNIKKNI